MGAFYDTNVACDKQESLHRLDRLRILTGKHRYDTQSTSWSTVMALTVYWIRHGATDWNMSGRYLGGTNEPLNAVGRHEAEALAGALAELDVEQVYSSPLVRATETADQLVARWHCPVASDDRLRELHFGDWEGRTVDDIQHDDAERWRAWLSGNMTEPFPGHGECVPDFRTRVEAFLSEHMHADRHGAIAVVTHGGVLRMAMLLLLQLDPRHYWSFQFGRASISCTVHSSGRVWIEYLNRCPVAAMGATEDEHA